MTETPVIPIAHARANLSDLIARTRHGRQTIILTSRGKPQAALIPYETARLIDQAGGIDAIHKILSKENGGNGAAK